MSETASMMRCESKCRRRGERILGGGELGGRLGRGDNGLVGVRAALVVEVCHREMQQPGDVRHLGEGRCVVNLRRRRIQMSHEVNCHCSHVGRGMGGYLHVL